MKTKLIMMVVALTVGGCSSANPERQAASNAKAQETAHAQHAGGGQGAGAIPAYEEDPKDLPPTLDPEKFKGKTRLAYLAVREIPETIAQIPCYCHCDQTAGHKSLHSCYVDGHASSCAICVEEALSAYRMEKEEKLTPPQIRERIVAEFSRY